MQLKDSEAIPSMSQRLHDLLSPENSYSQAGGGSSIIIFVSKIRPMKSLTTVGYCDFSESEGIP